MPTLDLKREAGLVARFGGAGAVTTAVGLAVILALDVGLHVDRRLANAAGYLVGAGLSFFLQGRFVFRTDSGGPGRMGRYLTAMLAAFAVNQAVLMLAGREFPATGVGHTLAQLVAMGSYTAVQFVLFRLWVFRPAAIQILP
jgi:putative flippase GtrA